MIKNQNISTLFFSAVEKHANNVAIVADSRSINYGNLRVEVEKTASYFKEKGIGIGDRVLVFVPVSIDLYRIVLALFSLGATAVFLDEWVSLKRLKICAKIANCQGFIGITKAHLLRFFSKSIREIPIRLKISGRSENSLRLPVTIEDNHPALITFTTGSAGEPKAAIRTHQFLKIQFEILNHKVGTKPEDIEITNLPIVLFINLGIGATTVTCNFSPKKASKFNFANLVRKIDAHQVSRIVFSPYLLSEYCSYLKKENKVNRSIKQIFTGGGPVYPKEAKIVTELFPEIQAEIIFGSTEVEPISSISMRKLAARNNKADRGLAVGSPHHKAEVKIIEIADKPLAAIKELKSNEIGEIIVAGPHVLISYLNNTEAFKRNKIRVNKKIYHRTGDSGFLNDKNELFLTGRCQDIIQTSKTFYYPFLIENELREIEGIELGTLIQVKNQLILVVERSKSSFRSKSELEAQIRSLGYNESRISWTKIPRDLRHHTKIDTQKLKTRLSKKM